ncbi:MAG: hypothetical protein LBD58_04880 [Treponema sp.]|nr:hypothetical protein [Treponema sp.]
MNGGEISGNTASGGGVYVVGCGALGDTAKRQRQRGVCFRLQFLRQETQRHDGAGRGQRRKRRGEPLGLMAINNGATFDGCAPPPDRRKTAAFELLETTQILTNRAEDA